MARVFQSSSISDAQVRAALVESPGMADLWVYRVGVRGQAQGDALWFVTRDRDEATVRVWFGSVGMAQVKICFVDGIGLAGWRIPHPLKGRFS